MSGTANRTPVLAAAGLSRVYPNGGEQLVALHDVDIEVGPGEFVAVCGPSGCGKSTLLQVLGGLDRPDMGRVVIDGQPLEELSDGQLAQMRRRQIGFVLQSFNLLPTLTALENVAFPLLLDGVPDARERAAIALARVGLAHRAGHVPAQLSGGEQQRAALARALATAPAVVFADEPTGNLDSASSRMVLELLSDAVNAGETVMLATHDASVSERADRVVYMADGTFVVPPSGQADH